MIVYEERADLLRSGFQTLVCPVNVVGIMGNGLALAFKLRYPGLLEAYRKACLAGVFSDQGFFVYDVSETRKILCLPTKRHWRNPSKLEWIDEALKRVAKDFSKHGITSLGIPAIGCGKGQLEWEAVRPLILKHLEPIELQVGIFAP